MRKLDRNPNRGKRNAARLAQRLNAGFRSVERDTVKTKFRPGMTLAARERGIERMREARIAAIQAYYAGHQPISAECHRAMRSSRVRNAHRNAAQ